ncbi:hypothetical protein [Thermoactinospora rubra]|uniref:hypothetical protein n=1 Tax=Thermoactinospora rubra TaxID=1088767 RepID=UPI000A120B7E|nr:hypothetical protein [Thermoactinospora rubra]
MSDQSARHGIAGFQLTERTRVTELGTWIDAVGPDGRRGGALRFDPAVMSLPGVRDRVVSTVVTDRQLTQAGIAGLVPVADMVAAGEEVWLLTRQATTPTLSDLMSRPGLDPPSAAAVLVETAQTLLALHSSGIAHGSLHPGTVVIAEDGAALLAERGLADAVRGQQPSADRDVVAWAALARGLAAVAGTARAADLFERAAATATTHGLAAARDTLLAGRDALGAIGRDRLAEAARRWAVPAAPPGHAAGEGEDEGEIVTLLHVPGSAQHFGPGVPGRPTEAGAQQTTAEKIWAAGAAPPRARRRRTGRWTTVGAAAVFALILAGAVLAWMRLGGSSAPLAVQSVEVVAPKKTQGCDAVVRIVGTLRTNGSAGTIVYEWQRSDRKERIQQKEVVSEGKTSVTVPLEWTVKGEGKKKYTATLHVLSPVPAGKALRDKATFSYSC